MNVSPMNCNGVRINQIWNASIHLDHFAVSAFVDLLVMVNLGGAKVSKTAIIFHILYLQRNDSKPPPPPPTPLSNAPTRDTQGKPIWDNFMTIVCYSL